jgi:predicted MFS family arabinose efflux permease
MKLVAQWFRTGLGWRLGILLAALTLGTASPYLLFALGAAPDWRMLLLTASALSLLGGALVLAFVPKGPYLREAAVFEPRMVFRVFRHREFRLQAFGYFGHMWELYAFWSLIALYLSASFQHTGSGAASQVPLLAFGIIAAGSLGCILGGWISRRVGEERVALVALAVSGVLCASSWWLFEQHAFVVALAALIWGMFVIADSPQFSALAARHCPSQYTGTALTVQNGFGFGITVLSIQLTAGLSQNWGWKWAFLVLVIGPILGTLALIRLRSGSDPGNS